MLPFLIVRIFSVSLDDASTEFTPVNNYPGTKFDYTSTIYVDKINRIYIFGVYTQANGSGKYHDSIWFIDLTALASSSVWTVSWLRSSFVLNPNSSTQSSRLALSMRKLCASSLVRDGKDFNLIQLTAASTSSAEKGHRQSKCLTVQSRYSLTKFSSSATFLSWSTAFQSYPVCRNSEYSDSSMHSRITLPNTKGCTNFKSFPS
jgi:hypothetical protein